jgi:hypothetical protein
MRFSGGRTVSPPTVLSQIDRVATSQTFRGSPSLCKLLNYLGNHALTHPGESVKEYQVATEVFGRPANFDPKEDATVRVQAGRLRAKLAEYYASEGVADDLIVDLPKGVYALEFRPKGENHPADVGMAAAERHIPSVPTGAPTGSSWNRLSLTLLAGLILSLAALGYAVRFRGVGQAVASAPSSPEPMRIFWGAVLTSREDPWAVFSNAAFVGRPNSGMRYFDPARDHNKLVLDHYTGVGEVLGIHSLDQALASLNRKVRVKRGFLFTLDDARNNDLIFLGSPNENLTLLDIPSTHHFVFQKIKDPPRAGNVKVVNMNPGAGEAKEFLASASNEPLAEDYAIVALVRGIDVAHTELILAGTTTIGTQAAVEFVTDPSHVQELLGRLGAKTREEVSPFESVIRVKVSKGVPVESTIVALHKL